MKTLPRRLTSIASSLLLATALTGAVACAAGDTEPPRMSETYTQATAETELGHTLTGEVTEIGDDAIVVETATGAETLQVNDETTGRELLAVGHEVEVDFTRTAQGYLIATNIEHAEADAMN